LLLISPAAFAHGIPAQAMVTILIVWPMLITGIYGALVLLLRWKRLFKHQWITIISYILALGSLGLLAVSLWVFGTVVFELDSGNQDYFSEHYLQLFLLFLVVIFHVGVVTWIFRIPIKQYRQLAEKTNEAASSINNALGIKDNEG
jgi:hypothetical protein